MIHDCEMIFHFNELIFTFLNERYQINRQNYKVENICPFHTIKKYEKKSHGAIKLIWEITKCIFHFLCNSFFLIWHFKNVFWQKWNPSKGEICQIDGSYFFLQCGITLFGKYYKENIDEEKIWRNEILTLVSFLNRVRR